MGTSERREREKQKRRRDILDAARALFFEKGLRATTIDDIARSTELARGTIYLYFETKEEIYATILMEGLDILHALLVESYDPKTDALTNLLAGHDAYMRFHDEHPHHHSVMLIDKLEVCELIPEAARKDLDEKMAKMAQWIEGCLEEGVRSGIFRAMDPLQVAYMQMGMATGFALMIDRCAANAAMFPSREQARQVMHDLIAGSVIRRSS
jgi:AcrR family transcriptional regulator